MKNILSLKRAAHLQNRNITKQAKVSAPTGCGTPTCPDLYQAQGIGDRDIPEGQCICVNSVGYASFIFGEGIEIEGNLADGKQLKPVQNAWGGSNGYFKVTAKQDTHVYYLANYVPIEESFEGYTIRQIVALKDWQGTIQSKVDINTVEPYDGSYHIDFLYTGGAAVSVSYESKYDIDVKLYPDTTTPDENKDTVTGQFVSLSLDPGENGDPDPTDNTHEVYDASVTVQIKQRIPNSPEINFELKPNTIFDSSSIQSIDPTPEEDPDGLSAGAIAGIVIACVVVVAVVVFCVVWFVVLKKGCCGGGKNAEADA